MEKRVLSMYLLVAVFAILCGMCLGDQPPYQVSLYIHLHPKGRPIHLCNGAIVQTRLVLTSAACVHYHFSPNSSMIAIHPTMISVVVGSANALSDALIFKVSTINVMDKFNSTTMENDLAILRLAGQLPLGLRDDMKWIILDDNEFNDNPCLANFYVRNSLDNIPDYTQTEELEILDSGQCAELTKYPDARELDICSHYILPLGFDCNALEAFIPFNGDRGTGLVCNTRLVAVLSTILPLQKGSQMGRDCSELPVKAFYTNLGPHLDWIYEIIAYEEYIDILRDNYSASAPYQGEAGFIAAIKQAIDLATEPTETTTEFSTTEFSTDAYGATTIAEPTGFSHAAKTAESLIVWGTLMFVWLI